VTLKISNKRAGGCGATFSIRGLPANAQFLLYIYADAEWANGFGSGAKKGGSYKWPGTTQVADKLASNSG